MADLLAEVARFREWAGSYPEPRGGEWECDYDHWDDLYAAVLGHADALPADAWSAGEMRAVAYALARDNECKHLAREIRSRHPTAIFALAASSPVGDEPDARWQLAEQLGHLGGDEAERLLLAFAEDEDEYVRRRALDALTRIGSPAAERVALEAWNKPDEAQQWARMMALDCLRRTGSAHLGRLLAEAERDDRVHLREFAGRIRREESD